jgi:hypothetical protein
VKEPFTRRSRETSAVGFRLNLSYDQQMTGREKEHLIRQCAVGEITWHAPRERRFDNYLQVLGATGAPGLRPPVAPMAGPNVAALECGRAVIRKAPRGARR